MDDVKVHDYETEDPEGQELLRSFVDHTLEDRRRKIIEAHEAIGDAIGKTLGEINDLMNLPPMTEQERAAALVEMLLNWRAFMDGCGSSASILTPCAVYELQDASDHDGVRLIEGEPLSSILKKRPDLRDRKVVMTNEFFGETIYRIRKEGDGPGQAEIK